MNKLKEVRFFKKVSQALLALITGIQQARISRIENSLVIPLEKEKVKIAKALNVSVEDLFPEEVNTRLLLEGGDATMRKRRNRNK